MPGAASTSWSQYVARIQTVCQGRTVRVAVAFWLFGLINNVLYVILLSAALDLVGASIPKATVLLANVIPSLLVKLIAPYFIHVLPYGLRICLLTLIAGTGMLIVATRPDAAPPTFSLTGSLPSLPGSSSQVTTTPSTSPGSLAAKMGGIVLAAIAGGAGEMTFLSLTHFYGPTSLAAWASGTGAAGLVGAGAYAAATTAFGLSVRSTLLASAVLPCGLLLSYFALLPRPMAWRASSSRPSSSQARLQSEASSSERPTSDDPRITFESASNPNSGSRSIIPHSDTLASNTRQTTGVEASQDLDASEDRDAPEADEALLGPARKPHATSYAHGRPSWLTSLAINLHTAADLVVPFMIPLFLVFFAEYAINQGVAPTLLFPLESSPFQHYRAFYPTYNAIYQTGVFISRSSTPFVRVHRLYVPSILQAGNLALLIAQALFMFLPSVWWVFLVIFGEGLLGGLVYVNAFAEILDTVPPDRREFALGVTSASDGAGICLAGFVGMSLEVMLCRWQVAHGREWCTKL